MEFRLSHCSTFWETWLLHYRRDFVFCFRGLLRCSPYGRSIFRICTGTAVHLILSCMPNPSTSPCRHISRRAPPNWKWRITSSLGPSLIGGLNNNHRRTLSRLLPLNVGFFPRQNNSQGHSICMRHQRKKEKRCFSIHFIQVLRFSPGYWEWFHVCVVFCGHGWLGNLLVFICVILSHTSRAWSHAK